MKADYPLLVRELYPEERLPGDGPQYELVAGNHRMLADKKYW